VTDDLSTINADEFAIRPGAPRGKGDRSADQAETNDANSQSAGPASTGDGLEANTPSDCRRNDAEFCHQAIELRGQ
jgi:hypothetical protein